MKKIFAFLLLALTTMGAFAQENPNRLIIQPKQGNPSGYLVERLDSIYFTKVNGRVAADINLHGYTTGDTGDTL
ncbi:secreted protein, partial [gut metagenome]